MKTNEAIEMKINKMQIAAPTIVAHALHYQRKFGWSNETTELCLHWMILHGVKTIQDMESVGIKIGNYTRAFQHWALRSFDAFREALDQVASNH